MIQTIQGDCMQLMLSMPNKSVDLTLTDIPYDEVNRSDNGLRKLDKDKADIATFPLDLFLDEVCRITKGSVYIFCGTEQVSILRGGMAQRGMSTRLLIWEKTNPSPMNGQHIWLSGIECCVYGKYHKATFNEHCKNTVLRYPNGKSKVHPTEKPLSLISYLVGVSSNAGDTVFDPCMGSGTTGVACVNLNRNFIGYELDPDYYNTAKDRIEKADSQSSLFEEMTV